MEFESLKVVTPDGVCFAIFPNGDKGCNLIGDDLAINYFMQKTAFMTRNHGYLVNLDFISFDDFQNYCNRDDLGINITDEMNEADAFDLAVYMI